MSYPRRAFALLSSALVTLSFVGTATASPSPVLLRDPQGDVAVEGNWPSAHQKPADDLRKATYSWSAARGLRVMFVSEAFSSRLSTHGTIREWDLNLLRSGDSTAIYTIQARVPGTGVAPSMQYWRSSKASKPVDCPDIKVSASHQRWLMHVPPKCLAHLNANFKVGGTQGRSVQNRTGDKFALFTDAFGPARAY